MSNLEKIANKLARRDGVRAVLVRPADGTEEAFACVGEDHASKMRPVLSTLGSMFRSMGCPATFRVTIADPSIDVTIAARHENGIVVVIAYANANPVAKSVARMVRRAVASGGRDTET